MVFTHQFYSKEELRGLKRYPEEEKYGILKGIMRLFRGKPENLKDERKQGGGRFFECAAELKKAYDLRESLAAIFDIRRSKKEVGQTLRDLFQRLFLDLEGYRRYSRT